MNLKQALALGLCSVGEFKKEPVAYLYNGVRLGKLPVVEGYPYAFIAELKLIRTDYVLVLSQTNPYYSDSTDSVVFSGGNSMLYQRDYSYTQGENVWTLNSGESERRAFSCSNISDLWANTDILNDTDGSVFLKATDPIPVYE